MSRWYFFISVVLSCSLAAGCVTAQRLNSNVNPDDISYSASAAKKLDRIVVNYSDCLSDAFARISRERLNDNELPDMRAKTYEDACIKEERLLYQAIYSASRDHDPRKGYEKYAHNTARTGVEDVKKMTFNAIVEGFQPPK